MNSSKELASLIRSVEKEKLKYGISVLKELLKKTANESFRSIIDVEIEKIETQLGIVISNLEDDKANGSDSDSDSDYDRDEDEDYK
jgi:hypothetical protein